jgi:hypothetical protein
VAATAVLAPVAAQAAPAVQIPAAPAHQLVGDLAQSPADFLYMAQVASIQAIAAQIRFRSDFLEKRATRLEEYAAAHPGTFFGDRAATSAARQRALRAQYGGLSFSACNGGTGIKLGPYGSVTTGPC